jgi:hypothetical protein
MKSIYFILLFFLSINLYAETYIYDNEYLNIKLGVSTKEEVIALHGKSERKSFKSLKYKTLKFHYNQFQVTYHHKTGKVNTITILDPSYIDKNGIKIGFSKNVLEAVFKSEVKKNYLVDKNKGIIYWLKEGFVSKIVLTNRLLINS